MTARAHLLWAALLTMAGCGGVTAAGHGDPHHTEVPREPRDHTDSREWVWVDAPAWGGAVRVYPTEGAATDFCIKSGSVRACSSQGEWREFDLGNAQDHMLPTGRSGEVWVFDDDGGRVFLAHGFTGALTELPGTPASYAIGDAWHPAARLTRSGTLLRLSSSGFVPVPLAGRVYDAAFSTAGQGIALAEPGEVYLSDDGDRWTLFPLAGPAPEGMESLAAAALPERFAAVVEQAVPRSTGRPVEDPEVTRSWLHWLIRRFGEPHAITLPDLMPRLWEHVTDLGMIPTADDVSSSELWHLASGWLAEQQVGERVALYHVSPSAELRSIGEGPDGGVLASHDGRVALAVGEACPEATPPSGANACFFDAQGPHSIRLPANLLCARILALGTGQLVVGGDGCPADVCAGHPLVRFDLQRDDAPQPVPIRIEGDAPSFTQGDDPDECDNYVSDLGSAILPDGHDLRLAVMTPAGPRLLAGPLNGAVQSLRLPVEGDIEDVIFADAHHGVVRGVEETWTTSDGGATWQRAFSTPAWTGALQCSADACRVDSRYWMPAELAHRLGFAPASAATGRRSAESTRRPSNPPWRQAPITLPSLSPTASVVPLRPAHPSFWPAPIWIVVGGVVETAPASSTRPGAIRWHGVTSEGTPFQVATTARERSSPLAWGDHMALALTESFAVLLRAVPSEPGLVKQSTELVVVRRDGRTTRYPAPFSNLYPQIPEAHTIWPLSLPDGGLGLYTFIRGQRWLTRFTRDGALLAQRSIMGLFDVRDEMLAWHENQLGLATATADGIARLYLVSGGEREIAVPQTPAGGCAGEASPSSSRFASSWGHVSGELVPVSLSWSVSEVSASGACIRATAPRWTSRSQAPHGHGAELTVADHGVFRGWFISPEGTVEWTSRFPGQRDRGREHWIEESRWGIGDSSSALELVNDATGFEMWVSPSSLLADAGVTPGIFARGWGDAAGQSTREPHADVPRGHEMHLRPGMLLSEDIAIPLVGAAPRLETDPAARPRRSFLDAVANESGLTVVTVARGEGEISVDWVSPSGQPLRAGLPALADDELWRRAQLTPDGRRLVVLRAQEPRGAQLSPMAELRLYTLRPSGELHAGPALELPLTELGREASLRVASVSSAVIVAIGGSGTSSFTVLGAGASGAFRRLGHPIATTNCTSARVLAIHPSPPRIVWADCALGNRDVFLRVARLSGASWSEMLPAHPLRESFEGYALPQPVDAVGAFIDETRGVHMVFIQYNEAVLMRPVGRVWEEVSRHPLE